MHNDDEPVDPADIGELFTGLKEAELADQKSPDPRANHGMRIVVVTGKRATSWRDPMPVEKTLGESGFVRVNREVIPAEKPVVEASSELPPDYFREGLLVVSPDHSYASYLGDSSELCGEPVPAESYASAAEASDAADECSAAADFDVDTIDLGDPYGERDRGELDSLFDPERSDEDAEESLESADEFCFEAETRN